MTAIVIVGINLPFQSTNVNAVSLKNNSAKKPPMYRYHEYFVSQNFANSTFLVNDNNNIAHSAYDSKNEKYRSYFMSVEGNGIEIIGDEKTKDVWLMGTTVGEKDNYDYTVGSYTNYDSTSGCFIWQSQYYKFMKIAGTETQSTYARTYCTDINSSLKIVGSSNDQAIIWSEDTGVINLHTNILIDRFGAVSSYANSINNNDTVIGTFTTGDWISHGYILYNAFTNPEVKLIEGIPSMVDYHLNDINDNDQIIGFANNIDSTMQKYFIWDNGTFIDIDKLVTHPSWIFLSLDSINNNGEIACGYFTGDSFYGALINYQKATFTVLDDLTLASEDNHHIHSASSVNNNGYITGISLDKFTGDVSGYVLIPSN